ncbi:MAG TPA: hypothetical protein PLK29_05665 [Chiayiivirga sp.]|nr:hypothetical protein [Chiayiivirga sp.]
MADQDRPENSEAMTQSESGAPRDRATFLPEENLEILTSFRRKPEASSFKPLKSIKNGFRLSPE